MINLKKINISVAIDKHTDAFKMAETIDQLIKQLESRQIIPERSFTKKGITVDINNFKEK